MKYIIAKPSLVGLLSAVYDSYYFYKDADCVTGQNTPATLVDVYTESAEDTEKAKKVRGAIIEKGGRVFYDSVSDAYRSGDNAKEKTIAEYLKQFFRYGAAALEMYDNKAVIEFNLLVGRVRHEAHRISAFVRLRETKSGVFYGYYGSDNDIIDMVAPVLARRFNTQRFVLHDHKRRKMAFYDGKEIFYDIAPEQVEIELSEEEEVFCRIWRDYHKNISVKGRENPKLQKAFLPVRYRYFMNEF